MEKDTPESTPMVRVWKIVLLSAFFVFMISWVWHLSQMRDVVSRNEKDIMKVETDIAQLSAYRDVLKEKGKDAAKTYIEELRKNPYGI